MHAACMHTNRKHWGRPTERTRLLHPATPRAHCTRSRPPVEILARSLNLSSRPAARASRILDSLRVTRKLTVVSAGRKGEGEDD